MDGDAKINMSEFALGMKSSLTIFAKKSGGKQRPRSSAISGGGCSMQITQNMMAGTPMGRGPAAIRASVTPRRQSATPRERNMSTADMNRRSATGKIGRM